MRARVRRGARGLRQHACGSPSARNVEIEFGKPQLPDFPIPEGFADDAAYLEHLTFSRRPPALGRPAPRRGGRAAGLRAQGHRRHGLLVVLPDRVGPHQARPRPRHPGGPGPGQRGRLRGGLLPAHHRPRPHPVRPAVRALPQPVPHLDARHRHGLRLPLPRRDDPLRGRALRPRPRGPDRHLLHHQGPGRGARRGPGARLPLRRGRQGGQGHAAAGHGPRHAAVRLPRTRTPSSPTATRWPPSCATCTPPTPTPSRSSTWPGASRACAARTASTPPRW